MSDKPLQQIAEIQIDGENYDIAKNGGDFHIVRQKGPDAYGRPIATKLDISDFLGGSCDSHYKRRQQALLNLLGNALVSVRTQRDARLRTSGEAEG